jgi:hypothetical protein
MKCNYIKPDGDQCNSNAMTGSSFCFHHNPDIDPEEKRETQARGGRARALTLTKPLPPLKIAEPKDALLLIADTIKRVRAGELDIKTANCLGFLTDKLLKSFELIKLTEEIEKIETIIYKRETFKE